MFFTKDKWKKEWEALEKKEQSFLKKNIQEKESVLKQKLSDKIPDKLEDTLHAAFVKAFEMVFEYGTGIIATSLYEVSSGNSDCRSRRRPGRQCISEENNRLCGFEISSPLFKKEAVR